MAAVVSSPYWAKGVRSSKGRSRRGRGISQDQEIDSILSKCGGLCKKRAELSGVGIVGASEHSIGGTGRVEGLSTRGHGLWDMLKRIQYSQLQIRN